MRDINLVPLYDLSGEFADLYRQHLRDCGAVAEGDLANFTWDISYQDNTFRCVFALPEYWKWVEQGRPPTRQAGGWEDSVGDIRRWITVKHIVPRPDGSGRVPKASELAYPILKKIHKEGYEGRFPLSQALEEAVDSGLMERIVSAVTGQVANVALKEIPKKDKSL